MKAHLLALVLNASIGAAPASLLEDMIEIPAGAFVMGSDAGPTEERPAHRNTLPAYRIDRFPVTNTQFAEFLNAVGPFNASGERLFDMDDPDARIHRASAKWTVDHGYARHPVVEVPWAGARDYCAWCGKRLPTEAEWEKAARGGSDKVTMYPWGDQLNPGAGRGGAQTQKQAHFGFPNGPAKVGSYTPNGYGLYDMIGNVAEWTNDWYNRTYYSISPDKNPTGPDHGMYRVFRGSSWSDSDERMLGTHYRNYTNPELRTDVLGFRCARN